MTICTHNRSHYFGEIIDGTMNLSRVGVIADILWYQIPYHFHHVQLGEFVVMPNHIHGIIIIQTDNTSQGKISPVETLPATSAPPEQIEEISCGKIISPVETLHATSLPPEQTGETSAKNEQMAQISPRSHSLSAIIRSYKSAVTKHAHRLGFDFQWQTRFYDHIIRNQESFSTIASYIANNPAQWQEDKFFSPLVDNHQ